MARADGLSPVVVFVARLGSVWLLLLVAGLYGGLLGWRTGGFLMLAVCGMIGGHLLMGVSEYRRVMRRPWPNVSPLEDDDDDW